MLFSLFVKINYVQSHQGKFRSMNSFEPDLTTIDVTLEEGVQAGHESMKTWVEPDRASPVWECRGLVGERFWAQPWRRREKIGTTVQFCQIKISKVRATEKRSGYGLSGLAGAHLSGFIPNQEMATLTRRTVRLVLRRPRRARPSAGPPDSLP